MHLRWMVNLFLVLFNDCRWAMTNWKDVLTLRLLASTPAFFQPSHCIWEVCDWMWPGRRVVFCFLKLILGLCYVELQLFDEEKKKKSMCNLSVTRQIPVTFGWILWSRNFLFVKFYLQVWGSSQVMGHFSLVSLLRNFREKWLFKVRHE